MVKKRITNSEARGIARRRMTQLMDLAVAEVREGRPERARRYVSLARAIGMRTNTRMLKERLYCPECMIALVPGINCRVRLRSGRVGAHCLTCGHVRRVPYLYEKRGVEDAGEEKQERVGQDGVGDRPDRAHREGGPDRRHRSRDQGSAEEG